MSYFPTPFGHLSDWRIDPRNRGQASAPASRPRCSRRKKAGDQERDVQHTGAAEPADQPALRRHPDRERPAARPRPTSSCPDRTRTTQRIELRRNEIVIEIEKKKIFGFRGDHAVVVTAPEGTQVDASTASADVQGRGRFATSRSQRVRRRLVRERGRPLRGQHGERGYRRRVPSATCCGANSASGDVTLGETENDAKIRTASGDIKIRSAARGRIDVTSASGDVEVGIRRGSSVYIDDSSISGDMTSEMDVSDAPPVEPDGPMVDFRARTMSGDVKVRRA